MELSKLSDNFNNSILNHKLFKMILKNDFIIYGSILNEILNGNSNLDYFRKLSASENTITCYGKFCYREILERDIGEFIYKPLLLGNEPYSKTILLSYSILIENIKFNLMVLYIKNDIIDNTINFYKDLHLTTSLDKIQLSRLGLSVMDNKIGSKTPFIDLWNQISKKEFNVILKPKPFTNSQCDILKSLKKKGYKNLDCIIKPYYKKDQQCSICYDDEFRQFSQLECGHVFHKKCLELAVEEALKDSHTFSCPYCNNKYLNFEVI